MKICIIAQPRTRSNYMTFCASNWYEKNYNSKKLLEPYEDFWAYTPNSWDLISKKTEEIFLNQSFVVKIQTSDLAIQGTPYIYFSRYNLLKYDSIFLLYRSNIVDQISSLLVAYETRAYIHRERPNIDDFIVTFDLNKHYFLLNMIFEDYLKLTFVKKYLKENNKSFTPLEYNEVIEYTKENFPDTEVDCVETGFEYKNMITNYEFFKDLVETYFENFNFKI